MLCGTEPGALPTFRHRSRALAAGASYFFSLELTSLKIALPHPYAKRFGFTPMEMLILIVIISLLVTILFPIFDRSWETSVRSAGRDEAGIAHYTKDTGGRFPLSPEDSGLSVRL
jgi:hypothetical protein